MTGRAKGATHGSLVPESGWPHPLRGGGAQFPTEILGQFANRHRLKDGNRKTPCQPSAMIRGPDGGKTPSKGVEKAIFWGIGYVAHNGATPVIEYS